MILPRARLSLFPVSAPVQPGARGDEVMSSTPFAYVFPSSMTSWRLSGGPTGGIAGRKSVTKIIASLRWGAEAPA